MSTPGDSLFGGRPPVIEPSSVKVLVPCHGSDKDLVNVQIKNHSKERVVWKMRSTKPDKFTADRVMGFIDSVSSANVEIQPKQITTKSDYTKKDCFTFIFAVAAVGSKDVPKDVWKKQATAHTYSIKLPIVVEDRPVPRILDQIAKKGKKLKANIGTPANSTTPSASAKTITSIQKQRVQKEADTKVIVLPKQIQAPVPSSSWPSDRTDISIENKSAHRLAFKVKGTRLDRFSVYPAIGYIEPNAKIGVEVQPMDFDDSGEQKDRITVIVTRAPKDGDENWEKGQRHQLHIVYVPRLSDDKTEDNATKSTTPLSYTPL